MRPRPILVGLLIGTITLAGILSWSSTASAQRGRLNLGQETLGQEQILLAPRSLTRLLREGESAIQEKRYADGIEALGALLLEEPREDLPEDALQQDYFNEPEQDNYYRTSVRGKALQLLGSIPEEGRKVLEVQYGVAARQALSAAVVARDMDAISEVTRKYYHTEAGYDASILLAQEKLIRGYPIAAAGILERLSAFPAARKRFGAQLISESAGAWMQAGRPDLAVRALNAGSQYFSGSSILLAGRQSTLDGKQDWAKLLNQLYPKQSNAGSRSLESWLMTGGQPDRNGTVRAGLPMPIVAWHMSLHRERGDEESTNQLATNRESQNSLALMPKLEARMTGDLVLAKTASGNVFAIDLETGLRKWPFYKDGVPIPINWNVQKIPEGEDFIIAAALRNRIWGSSAFGQFTIDANQLYYITNSEEQRVMQSPLGIPRGTQPAHNMLIGVSLQGEGKEMWQVGGVNSPSEPELANAYFLGPPLSFEGDLYALVEINLETRLVVLDSRTGKLQWAQQLTLSPMTPIRNDPLRQSQALTPSVSDSVIVCPIGNGAIIAVDLLTRSLLWGKQYAGVFVQPGMQGGFQLDTTDSYDALEDRWVEPQVIIQNGRVVFTPVESQRIMCLDLLTGETRWELPRGASRYVAGVYQDKAIIVSNTSVQAVNLTDGKASWGSGSEVLLNGRSFDSKDRTQSQPVDIGNTRGREVVAGKSVRDGQYLYVPTTAQRVLKIDLEAGKLVDAARVEQPLGNLFAFKNHLISVGATRVTAYYTRDALAQEVEQRLAANAKDHWALNQKSQLLTADGKIGEAIELLRKSYAVDPENGETRYLLVDALLTGLERDFDRYLPLASEFEPIIESQRFRFLVLLARGNIKAGQYELAFSRLMELVRERTISRQPGLQARMQSLPLSPGHEVDIDAWVAVQLGVAFDQAPPQSKEKMLKLIQDRLQAGTHSHPLARQAELRFFSWLSPAHPAILEMVGHMFGKNDQTKAERLVQPLLYGQNPQLRDKAAALMSQSTTAEINAATRFRMRADGDLTPADANETPDTSPVVATNWPNGMIEARVSSNAGPGVHQTRMRFSSKRYGRGPVDLSLMNGRLRITDSQGEQISALPFLEGNQEINDGLFRAQVDGGLVFVETARELIAMDMYRTDGGDPVLWRHSMSLEPTNPTRQHFPQNSASDTNLLGMRSYSRGADRESIIGPVTPGGVVIQKNSEVMALDVLTGQPLWSRRGYDNTTTLVFSGLELAIVSAKNAKIDVLDCRDGSLIRQVEQPEPWKSIFAAGRHVVQMKPKTIVHKGPITRESADACEVRLLDALTGKIVASTSFAPSTRSEKCGDRFFVAIEESGRLWYCNVEAGLVVEHQLDKQPKLAHVRLQQFGDRLVAWTTLQYQNSAGIQIKPEIDEGAMNRGLYAINGSIIALEAETGRMLWDRAGALYRFTFNSAQPRHSPYLGFYRVVGIGGSRTAHLAVIDLRDGTLAYGSNSLPINIQGLENSEFTMNVDSVRHSVEFTIGTTNVKLQVTEEEKPPQPVCFYGAIGTKRQTGASFSLPR